VLVHGRNLKYLSTPQVTVGGVAAQILQADQLSIQFKLGASTTTGPIEIRNEAGTVQLTGPFTAGSGSTHPGFFVVSGPSSVSEIVQPRPVLASGDTLIIRGQNLARLSGICLLSSGQGGAQPGSLTFSRVQVSGGSGYEASNTVMEVVLDRPPVSLAPGPVQLYGKGTTLDAYGNSQYVCSTNPAGIQWP
jgi:hypothetical protein